MTIKTLFTILITLGVGIVAGWQLLGHGPSDHGFGTADEISWRILAQLSPRTGEIPDFIREVENHDVKLAGFVVPLTDNFQEIREFLLVPDSMSCIHVPPPPTNQMVLVELDEPMNPQLAYGPVWVHGQLKVKPEKNVYGVSSYKMNAKAIKIYNEKRWK